MQKNKFASFLKKKTKAKFFLVSANILIVALCLCFCFKYTKRLEEREALYERENFLTNVNSMKKVVGAYLRSQQQSCNNWAAIINSQNLTLNQTINMIANGNSVSDNMFYITDYESLEGIAANKNDLGKKISFVSYKENFKTLIDEVKKYDFSCAHITQTLESPVDSKPAIYFCQDIQPSDGDKHYMLMRSVSLSVIQEQWVFPSGYEKAECALITKNGDYIIRPPSFKNENFWEYIKCANALTDNEKEAVQNSVCSGQKSIMELLNADGISCYFAYFLTNDNNDWIFIGSIPKDFLLDTEIDFALVVIIFLGFLLICILNGTTLLITNLQLMQTSKETRKANEAKTNFLSSMSHDIRTPMNAIIGMTTIAEKNIQNAQKVSDCLAKIKLASGHLLTLVNDVLDISKIESGKLMLNPVDFSLAKSVENLVNINLPLIREKNLQFCIETKNIIYENLLADELRVNQIFINILSNAIKYTDEGGKIKVCFSEEEFFSNENAVMLSYSVEDNGIGMSEEFQKNMYESFARAVDNRVDKIAGSGLGLAIAKQMTDLMGGTIECKSVLNEGSVFTIKIPFEIIKKAQPYMPKFEKPKKIVFITSDKNFAKNATEITNKFGKEFVAQFCTECDKEFLENFLDNFNDKNFADLAIIDSDSKKFDAMEFASKLCAKNEKIKIAITCYDVLAIEEKARFNGIKTFISKPIFYSTFCKKICEVLQIQEKSKENDINVSPIFGTKILVSEDNDLNWEITSEMLNFYGAKTVRAENGAVCLEMIKNAKEGDYDAILMDIQMPVLDGKSACRAIRALSNDFAKKIPIIAITADAFAEDVQSCIEAGMNAHLAKPINFEKLQEILRRHRAII